MSEGFANAVIGGASKLIREAIQSVNYVAGIAGWRLSKDGDAEFNSAIVRGFLKVQATGGNAYISIFASSSLAFIELQPETAGLSQTIFPGQITTGTDTINDEAFVLMYSPVFAGQPAAQIQLVATTAVDCGIRILGQTFFDVSAQFATLDVTTYTLTAASLFNIVAPAIKTDALIQFANGNERYGKGRIQTIIKTTDTAIAGAELIVATFSSYTFEANRAYKVMVKAKYSPSAASGQPSAKLRKGTTIAGAILADNGRLNVVGASADYVTWDGYFVCGGSNVTTQICMGIGPSAVGTVTMQGTSSPCVIELWDVGPAADYNGLLVLT